MSQNEDELAALVLAQQRALESANARENALDERLVTFARIHSSLVRALPQREDTPRQCPGCQLWAHPAAFNQYEDEDGHDLCDPCGRKNPAQRWTCTKFYA